MISRSAQETKKIAAKIAKKIIASRSHKNHARVIALVGDLGAGKTTFVQGLAKALGIKNRIASPTFLIFRRYKNFFHADVYRIKKSSELAELNFKKILSESENIVVIEWAEKIRKILPKDTIWVEFTHGRKETERTIAYRR